MLEYFYTLKYTTNYPDAYVRIDIYARMYAIADKYEIKALKTIAAMNFQSEFPHAVEQAAWRSKLPQEIVSIADTVYTTTPDPDTTLRCTVATCVWEKVCFLSLSPNFKKTSEMWKYGEMVNNEVAGGMMKSCWSFIAGRFMTAA